MYVNFVDREVHIGLHIRLLGELITIHSNQVGLHGVQVTSSIVDGGVIM